MKEKLNCILLVDDDEATNFIHEMVIEDVGCTKNIIEQKCGRDALDFLKSIKNEEQQQPQLIFIDINMPTMSGWEFLDEYKKLREKQRTKQIIVMLTTSINPEDKNKAKAYSQLSDFKTKPLTQEILYEIFEKHFTDYL